MCLIVPKFGSGLTRLGSDPTTNSGNLAENFFLLMLFNYFLNMENELTLLSDPIVFQRLDSDLYPVKMCQFHQRLLKALEKNIKLPHDMKELLEM
jgi:hypothetical protein